jgi:hypothetical protein
MCCVRECGLVGKIEMAVARKDVKTSGPPQRQFIFASIPRWTISFGRNGRRFRTFVRLLWWFLFTCFDGFCRPQLFLNVSRDLQIDDVDVPVGMSFLGCGKARVWQTMEFHSDRWDSGALTESRVPQGLCWFKHLDIWGFRAACWQGQNWVDLTYKGTADGFKIWPSHTQAWISEIETHWIINVAITYVMRHDRRSYATKLGQISSKYSLTSQSYSPGCSRPPA